MNLISLSKAQFPLVLVGLLFMGGCSSLLERQSLFDDATPKRPPEVQTVPKAQYDQLLAKYEALLQQNNAPTNMATPAVDTSVLPVEGETAADVVENLAQSTTELNETVDVFGDGKAPQNKSLTRQQDTNVAIDADPDVLENQLLSLRKARKLVEGNQFNPAMAQLKGLEDSSFPQIRVRAKYLIGDILYKQQSYDLSMQVFEDIVHNYSFSGVVLDALRKLIVCSEKLNLPKKKELYFSMLHDFF